MCINNNKYNSNFTLPTTYKKNSDKKNNKRTDKLPVKNVKNEYIIFSYKYFKRVSYNGSKFNNCFKNEGDYAKWITFCLDRVSHYSTMKITEISGSGTSTRFHTVEGKALNKLKSILKTIGLDSEEVFQQDESDNYYELSFGTGNGRIFGYLINNIYYILLLDPNHLIYPNTSKCKDDLYHKHYKPWESLLDGNDLRR